MFLCLSVENNSPETSHARDGGKTEVSDYWRNPPGQSGGQDPAQGQSEDGDAHGAPRSPDAIGDDTLRGQSGEDELRHDKEPPKGAFIVADPEKLVREWSGTRQGPNEKEKFECVGLVKTAIPEIGPTSAWEAGEKILGPDNPPLTPGTAIATFNQDGKYANKSGESHAGIFLEYGSHNGKDGMWIMDQHRNQPARRSFLSFKDSSRSRTYQAERYSIIRRTP